MKGKRFEVEYIRFISRPTNLTRIICPKLQCYHPYANAVQGRQRQQAESVNKVA